MRSRSSVLIAGAALVVASAARAAPLLSATWTSTTQGIHLSVTNGGATCTDTTPGVHVQQSIVCPTAGLGATGSATATSYSVSLALPLFSIRQFTTGGVGPFYTKATLSGAAAISGNASAAAATMGVPGAVTVKAALHVGKGANASKLTQFAVNTLVLVPLSVGKAGMFSGYFYVLGSLAYITVDFYAWTPHTRTFTGLTSKYQPLPTPTVVAMGSFGLTPMGGGMLTLVSPSKISIDGMLPQRRTVSLTTLTLTYAPEPGTLLLLGAGSAGLLLARSRRKPR